MNGSNQTLQYYNENAQSFIANTLSADMSAQYDFFLPLLPEGGSILDLGCGSGRDSLFFKKQGYRITAVDGSPALCDYASSLLGQPVECLKFNELNYRAQFDGVWACASLLHLPLPELTKVIERIAISLKPGGILYASFKYGTGSHFDDKGRYYCNFTEDSARSLFYNNKHLKIINVVVTEDVRKDITQKWLNIIVKKEAH
ncbi:MAG: class I SAM-dependent methyltransferase [Oscillospiraceae bacterium]|nr:class I SAM-dependent methyltransferase [Oscillospiraceae bacterium]